MKFLLLILVLVVAYMIWRNGRIRENGSRAAPPPKDGAGPQDMLSCPVCTVHFPRSEGVVGGDGRIYCSQEHRLRGGSEQA